MTDPFDDRDPHEIDQVYGEYDGTSCEFCGRERVIIGAATGRRCCEKCGAYQNRPYTFEAMEVRAMLAQFSPEHPFMVGPRVYEALLAKPELADLMDRVRLYPDLVNMARHTSKPHMMVEVVKQALSSDRLTLDELTDPMKVDASLPSGRRYGPYDADPHTKGRRRRFRTQRKA